MDKECCGKCESLITTDTDNLYVNEQRKTHKRWNEKYSDLEIENIKHVLLSNYDKSDESVSKGILMVPTSVELCIIKLQGKSGRPFYGFVSKLYSLKILNKNFFKFNNRSYIRYGLNKKFFK